MPVTVRQRNLQAKGGVRKLLGGGGGAGVGTGGRHSGKKHSFWSSKTTKKANEGDVLVTNAPTDSKGIVYPGTTVALLCLLSARLGAAVWSHITDCDETYNYWEPIHYLVYGHAMQTWEYSPAYAIRSYASLWIFAGPAKLLTLLMDVNPVVVFYLLRYMLAIITSLCEVLFYKAVCQEFGVHVGRMWLALALVSCGAFVSSAAMLPSAWCAALSTAALASWWLNRLPSAVFLTACSTLIGWPFAGLLGLPIAVDIIFRRWRILDFLKWSTISLLLILTPIVAIDSWYYGKLVIAPWNIVAYNIFTEHGPDLYGVEPWTFYFLNGFLNFNVVWVLALMCPLLLALCSVMIRQAKPRIQFCQPYWLSLLPLYSWLAVFLLQPHKEERFLFPVYSMVGLCGAISIDCIQKITFTLKAQFAGLLDRCLNKKRVNAFPAKRTHYLNHTNYIMVIFVLVSLIGGLSRIVALYRNYHAPMDILRSLPEQPSGPDSVGVCFGKDWYRAPSSFFLPGDNYRMRFIKSQFRGLMPAQYAGGSNATRLIHNHFNDRNEEDNSTYLNATDCHYLVDSDVDPATPLQPIYANDKTNWHVVASVPFLNANQSHRLFRAFYIPLLDKNYTIFGNIHLLRNKILVNNS